MHRFQPSEKFITVWRLRLFAVMALIAFLCGILFVLSRTAAVLTAVVLLVICLVLWFWYIPALYQTYKISISDGAISLAYGVIFSRQYVLPCPRLIYAQRNRTPLESLFSLCSIRLHVARGQLMIPILTADDAVSVLILIGQENVEPDVWEAGRDKRR